MSDPATPVDVIARAVYESKPDAHHNRKPVAWDDLPHFGWSSWQPNYLNRAATIITALSEAGYEIVRAAPEPDAPEITDEMEGEALRVLFADKKYDVAIGWYTARSRMRAALDAALKARRSSDEATCS